MSFKKLSFYLLVVFFTIAGINHFINPDFYVPLIPDYLFYKEALNMISGFLEVILGIALIFPRSRYYASLGLVILMVLFIPSHIHFIMEGSCIHSSLCVSPIIAWLRLIIIHPLIISWIWINRRN